MAAFTITTELGIAGANPPLSVNLYADLVSLPSSGPAAAQPAFDLLSQWPVRTVAAAVVSSGAVSTRGDVDRPFALASVTKPLVAYAVAVAIEEGVVELDEPAGPPGATVRHLLAHASGLAFDEARVVAGPGAKRIYSSAGFEVLAALVAERSQIAFPEYLRQAVFEPLGMTASVLTGSAGHGASSSVRDLAAFVGELRAPTLLDPSTVGQLHQVQFPGLDGIVPGYGTFKPNDWGLGFELRGHKSPHWTGTRNSPATFGHFGQAGTFFWLDPEADAAAIVLTDEPFGAWAKPLWPVFSDTVLASLGR